MSGARGRARTAALQSARRGLDNGRGSEQGALAGWDGSSAGHPRRINHMKRVQSVCEAILTWLETRGCLIALTAVGIYFTIAQLWNLDQDTTAITNTAFAICASLASVSFGYARALNADDKSREAIVHAGERLFHAALLLLVASLIKYAALRALASDAATASLSQGLRLLGFISALLFIRSLFFALTGIQQLTILLWSRPRVSLADVEKQR